MTTTEILLEQIFDDNPGFDFYIPMIDARRDEVYMSIYNSKKEMTKDVHAQIISDEFFESLGYKKVY